MNTHRCGHPVEPGVEKCKACNRARQAEYRRNWEKLRKEKRDDRTVWTVRLRLTARMAMSSLPRTLTSPPGVA